MLAAGYAVAPVASDPLADEGPVPLADIGPVPLADVGPVILAVEDPAADPWACCVAPAASREEGVGVKRRASSTEAA